MIFKVWQMTAYKKQESDNPIPVFYLAFVAAGN